MSRQKWLRLKEYARPTQTSGLGLPVVPDEKVGDNKKLRFAMRPTRRFALRT